MPKLKFSIRIQPIKLPKTCIDTSDGGIQVYAVGIGDTHPNKSANGIDRLLRQAPFSTCFHQEYAGILNNDDKWINTSSVILARSINGNDIGDGDSGWTQMEFIEFF